MQSRPGCNATGKGVERKQAEGAIVQLAVNDAEGVVCLGMIFACAGIRIATIQKMNIDIHAFHDGG